MEGSSATTFNPNGNLTIAEALVLACRLRSTYVGDGETFAASGGCPVIRTNTPGAFS